ncbi:MAG: glycosyltransferase [Candidatus Omnitrophica bacterium]|nr:glycosyltransferase [Candidatus Omnitrophota bacterium]
MSFLILLVHGYLLAEWTLWVQRALTMLSSMRRYNVMPAGGWKAGQPAPKVSMIIPCRNEEKNLPRLLPTLRRQNYPNLEFVLIDDRSEDRTPELLKAFAASEPRAKALSGRAKPADWTGKAHALHQAVGAASGEWYLFSDADTQHQAHSVSSALAHALDRRIDFLTLTSHYLCESFAEYLVQPMAIGCFAVWFRLQDVNDPKSRVPLACGHFILIRREAYEGLGGFEAIRGEVLEDLALFKRAKADGRFKFELSVGSHVFATRMYDSFIASWRGWRRIFMHSLNRKVSTFLSKIAALVFNSAVPFAVPLVCIAAGTGTFAWQLAFASSIALCGFIIFLRTRSHQTIGLPAWPAVFHPLSALIIAAILTDCLAHLILGWKVEWKQQKY